MIQLSDIEQDALGESFNLALGQAAAVFAGGELSDEDRLAFMTEIQQLYLESKDIAAKKFTPKKYRKDDAR